MSSNPKGVATAGLAFGIAIGTAFGAYVLGPHSGASGVIASHDSASSEQLDSVKSQLQESDKSLGAADDLGKSLAPDAVRDRLKDKSVLLISTSDANQSDVDAVKSLIEPSGGSLAGTITLTDKFESKDSSDSLKTIATNTLPAGVQLTEDDSRPGMHIGELMAGAFLKSPSHDGQEPKEQSTAPERNVVKDALDQGGLAHFDGDLSPADVAIVVTGDHNGKGDNDYAAELISSFAIGVGTNGEGAVLASRLGAAKDEGAVARIRENDQAKSKVATVDDVEHITGQVNAIRAAAADLDGKPGAFGIGAGATAAVAP